MSGVDHPTGGDEIPLRITIVEGDGVIVPQIELSPHLQHCAPCRNRYFMYAVRTFSMLCNELERVSGETSIETQPIKLNDGDIPQDPPAAADILQGFVSTGTKAN